jgi:hypothetical protein
MVVRGGLKADEFNMASFHDLRHLMQLTDPSMAGKMLQLDEKVMAQWDNLSQGERIALHRTRVEIEIDAQNRVIGDTTGQASPQAKLEAQQQLQGLNAELDQLNLAARSGRIAPELGAKLDEPARLAAPGGKDVDAGGTMQVGASAPNKTLGDHLSELKIPPNDASKIKRQLEGSDIGKQIESYINKGIFSDTSGYKDLVLQLKQVDMHDSVLQAMQVGERIQQSRKGKIFFESKGPNYDIDVGDMLPDGTMNNVYQLKVVDTNQSVSKNLTKGAKQLVHAPANNRIVEINVKNGSWDEFKAQGRVQGIERTFSQQYPTVKVNINFSDGVSKSWF